MEVIVFLTRPHPLKNKFVCLFTEYLPFLENVFQHFRQENNAKVLNTASLSSMVIINFNRT